MSDVGFEFDGFVSDICMHISCNNGVALLFYYFYCSLEIRINYIALQKSIESELLIRF